MGDISFTSLIDQLSKENNQKKPSSKVTEIESVEVSKVSKISISDERDAIVNNLLTVITDGISDEQNDLRKHRKTAIMLLSFFLSIVTVAVFVLLYLMILLDKGELSVRLALITAVFADTLGLVYIVFRYLFDDAHKNHSEIKDILKIYNKNVD